MKLRVLASALLVLVLSLAGTVPASAHAALVSSTPEGGAELDRLPGQVTFTFSEDVSDPAYVVVRAADGTSVTSGDPVVEGATVTQRLGGTDATGRFTMAYRVVSVDGHPVTGELAFTVSGEAGTRDVRSTPTAEPADEPSDQPTDEPTETAVETTPTSAEAEEGFWAEHGVHYAVGGALLAVALVLLLTARRRPG